MENIDSSIDKITTYEEYCSFIEKNYVDRQHNKNLFNLERHIDSLDIEEKHNILLEIECLGLWAQRYYDRNNGWIKDVKFMPAVRYSDDLKYLEKFTDADIKYLKERVKNSKNNSIIARFSDIIWQKTKQFDYAKCAISSYLLLLDDFKKQKDEEYEWERIFELAAFISIKFSCEVDKVKNLAFKILDDKNASPKQKMKVIGFLSANRSNKEIKKDFDLNKLENACEEIYQEAFSQDIFKLGREVSKDKNKWIRREAEFWEERANGTDPISASFAYQQAIPLYRQIGDKNKVDELNEKCADAIQSAPITEHELHIKAPDILETVSKLSSDDIIRELIRFSVPDYEIVEKNAKKNPMEERNIPLSELLLKMGVIDTTVIDKFGNKIASPQNPEEKVQFLIARDYNLHISSYRSYLYAFIKAAIEQGKISGEILIKYLEQHSWIGRIIKKRLANGEILEYKWIDFIKEPIMSFFNKFEKFIKKEADYPNLMMETDSLVLKIEGMLRDMLGDKDLSTYYYNKEGNFYWKNINNYLEDLEQVLSKNDIEFMKYFLINKEYGYNLRNNIAHCLMFPNEYGIGTFLCLIIIILRLSLYAMKQDA